MTDADKARFAKAVNGLASTFRVTLGADAFSGYWVGLEDVPIEAVEYGIAQGIRACKFMPTPSELRELAGVLMPERLALEAWQTVIDAPKTGESVLFQDGITARAIDLLGGWYTITDLDSDAFHTWARKEFLRLYVLLDKGLDVTHAPALSKGWLEIGQSKVAAPYLGPLAQKDVPKLAVDERAQRVIDATADFMRGKLQ